MRNFIDKLINGVTMYRLILYYLVALWGVAAIFSLFGLLPFTFFALMCETLVMVVACVLTNLLFAYVFKVPVNIESAYITAFILILIITPPLPFDKSGLWFLLWASIWAMACKYIIAIKKKHVFNPAAFAVALTAITMNQSASWWVGTALLMPFVLLGGILITRKIQRFDLVFSCIAAGLVTMVLKSTAAPLNIMFKTLLNTPLLFFTFVMATEPLTTPPTRGLRIIYGVILGILSSPSFGIGNFYLTPELALLVGNIFSYLVSPKGKYLLTLKDKIPYGKDIYDFVFRSDLPLAFDAGQYLEWTLGHKDPDDRGNRRYFTLASSPTEKDVHLGVKFYPDSSTYKKVLLRMRRGDKIMAGQLAGDFTLPKNKAKKMALIGGGIGITPFRSMMKYLLDKGEKRPIVLFYTNKNVLEIAYDDVFREADQQLGTKTVYVLTDKASVPPNWKGETGYITAAMIARQMPDYKERTFYISGPHAMVDAYQKTLQDMGIRRSRIKVDFFPGF